MKSQSPQILFPIEGKLLEKHSNIVKEKLSQSDRIKAPPIRLKVDPSKDVTPRAHSRSYDIPYNLREPMNRELSDAIEAGVLTPCNSHSDWINQMFPVPKPGKSEVRLVRDFKRSNSALQRPVFPVESNSQLLTRSHQILSSFAR